MSRRNHVININSERAKRLLKTPKFVKDELNPLMKRFPGDGIVLWVNLEWENNNVKNLSFFGQLEDYQKIILESMASLLIGRPLTQLDILTIRECEAFLRDRNSEASIDGMTEVQENELKKVFQWLRVWPQNEAPTDYTFSNEKGPFYQLKLVDKVKAIKAFLNSPEILTLYQGLARPELVDVEDLTVYIHAPYVSQREKSLFEELHLLGVEAFQEENLNFIPDA
jgi:hypothetical protein